MGIFSELRQFCCSAGVLPAWYVYTHWHRGKTEKGQSPEYFKIFGKKSSPIFNNLFLNKGKVFALVVLCFILIKLLYYIKWNSKLTTFMYVFRNIYCNSEIEFYLVGKWVFLENGYWKFSKELDKNYGKTKWKRSE